MTDETKLVKVGSFCPTPTCPDYAKLNAGNIIKYGKQRNGTQRFRCNTCGATCAATFGTIFFGRHRDPATILLCFKLLAERNSLAAIHRITGVKEETVVAWLEQAAAYIEEIEALLLANYPLQRIQLDALWSFVGHKGEKGGAAKSQSAALIGAALRLRSIPACGWQEELVATSPA